MARRRDRIGERESGQQTVRPVFDESDSFEVGWNGDYGGQVGLAVFRQCRGGDPPDLGFGEQA